MKKFFIRNKKFIYGIIVGSFFSSVVVYAATSYLASDITYKDTTVEAALNDLYNNKCVTGSFVGKNCSTTNGQKIPIDFVPSKFFLSSHSSNPDLDYTAEYDKNAIGENIYYTWNTNGKTKYSFSHRFKISDNSLFMHNFTVCENNTFYYIACK